MEVQFNSGNGAKISSRLTVPVDGLRRTRRILGYPDWFFNGTELGKPTASFPDSIPLRDYFQIVENVCAKIPDPSLHLDLSRSGGPAVFGNLALGMQHAPTLGDGLKLYAKYSNGAYPFFRFSWKTNTTGMGIRLDSLVDNHTMPYLMQNALLNFARYVRQFRSSPPDACKVSFCTPPIYDPHLYPIGFQCPVQFEAARTFFFVPDKWVTEKNINSDEALWRMALSRIKGEMQLFGQLDPVSNISRLIEKNRTDLGKPPRINLIAKILGISARTLNRQLASEHTSFQQLLETVQKQRAEELMIHSQLTIENISELLGYSDQSSFGRSFRRWFGVSPNQYRNKNDALSLT